MSKLLRRAFAVLVVIGLTVFIGGSPAGAAVSHQQITGSGSSWAANAVNQWVGDVNKNGLRVVFTSTGSAQGRQDFANVTTDFGVSDIAYQGVDQSTGQADTSKGRPYAYLPIVAGGTSFPYHLGNGAQQVRNLRLSGLTLAKIFTNQITNWDDKAITADNNGHALPSLPIIPVVHAEGSGSTAQFTQYLSTDYASTWGPYNNGSATFTEYYPRKGNQVAQNGSDGVMNFITSAAGNGSIGFDEYSYALLANFPVAKMLNSAGYYTAPTQYNVAVALTAAQINNDPSSVNYLTQTLNNVYVNPDSRTYPLSSYSYAIIPTGNSTNGEPKESTAARQTQADFFFYSICQGQAEIGPTGYSALPINLVQAGFDQLAKLKQADPNVELTNVAVANCNNPTFIAGQPTVNHLAQIAPLPPACDKQGAGPCSATVGVFNGTSPPPAAAGAAPGGKAGAGAGSGTGTGGPSAGASTGASAGSSVDPLTGQTGADGSGGSGSSGGVDADTQGIANVSTTLADSSQASGLDGLLGVFAVILLLLVLIGPVVIVRVLARRKS